MLLSVSGSISEGTENNTSWIKIKARLHRGDVVICRYGDIVDIAKMYQWQ